jgi:hypothetical protein
VIDHRTARHSGNTPSPPAPRLRFGALATCGSHKSCGVSPPGLVDGVSHGRALPLSPDLAAVPSRLLQVPFGDDRAGAVIVPGEKLKLRGLQPPTYDQSGTSGRGTPLGGSPTWTRDKCPPHARARPRALHRRCTKRYTGVDPPKVGGKSMPKVDGEFGNPLVRARITQCPRRARWPASPAASHAHTTLLGASGARRCGSLDCAPWSLRASATRPRATAAAATRAPRGVWARCMRRAATECAPPPPERHSGAARASPNAQVSERAKACRARRTR